MYQGDADEAVVVVKLLADDDVVTYPRRKLQKETRKSKAKGGTGKAVTLTITTY